METQKVLLFFRSLKNMIQNMAVYMYNNNPQKSMKVFFRDSDRKFATFEIRWSVYVVYVFQTNNSRAFGAFENFLAIFILIYTSRMTGFIKQSAQKNSAIWNYTSPWPERVYSVKYITTRISLFKKSFDRLLWRKRANFR